MGMAINAARIVLRTCDPRQSTAAALTCLYFFCSRAGSICQTGSLTQQSDAAFLIKQVFANGIASDKPLAILLASTWLQLIPAGALRPEPTPCRQSAWVASASSICRMCPHDLCVCKTYDDAGLQDAAISLSDLTCIGPGGS